MKRLIALAVGVPAVLAAGLALGPGDVRAGQKEKDDAVEKVERKIVVRHAGGGRLGVSLEETEGALRGARVRSVEEDSPAAKAGIKEGDVVVRFDGEAVRSATQLARLVGETPAGRPVAIEVSRDGATQKLEATLAEGGRRVRVLGGPGMREFAFEMPDIDVDVPEPPAPPDAPRAPLPHAWAWRGEDGRDMVMRFFGGGPRRLGIEYMEVGEQLAAHFGLPAKSGVLVSSVDADSPAAKAGMKAGDLVLKLDGKTIEDGRDLREAVAEAGDDKAVTVTVKRDGRTLDLQVTLAKPERSRRRAPGLSL